MLAAIELNADPLYNAFKICLKEKEIHQYIQRFCSQFRTQSRQIEDEILKEMIENTEFTKLSDGC